MEPLVEPYNMFAQQKQQGYNSYRQQQAIQGQVQGYSPEQFAQGKAAANSQASGYGANPQPVQQPSVTQPAPVQKTTPTKTTPVYTGGSTDPNAGANYLASLLTTPQREEELRKQSVQRQRIMAVGDALRHIGNIFNTVNGAPSQKFSSPVEEERKRYLQEKALRDANNYKYMTYQQAKAAQDAKMRQAEAQMRYNMEKDARDYELKKKESDARANLNEARMHRYQTQMELDQARKEGIISDNEWRKRRAELYPVLTQSQIDRNNRTGGGRSGVGRSGGSNMPDYEVITENTLNDDGRVISQKKTRTVKRDGQSTTSTKTTNKSNVSNFSIRSNNTPNEKKTNVGSFSIHK